MAGLIGINLVVDIDQQNLGKTRVHAASARSSAQSSGKSRRRRRWASSQHPLVCGNPPATMPLQFRRHEAHLEMPLQLGPDLFIERQPCEAIHPHPFGHPEIAATPLMARIPKRRTAVCRTPARANRTSVGSAVSRNQKFRIECFSARRRISSSSPSHLVLKMIPRVTISRREIRRGSRPSRTDRARGAGSRRNRGTHLDAVLRGDTRKVAGRVDAMRINLQWAPPAKRFLALQIQRIFRQGNWYPLWLQLRR